MKAISIWQPHATLMALALKEYETRSWPTSYRGRLAIHAAKSKDTLEYFYLAPFLEKLTEAGIARAQDLPLGAMIATAELVDCVPTVRIARTLSAQELAFGNFAPGRWAWKLANVRAFAQPIPVRGQQGLWEWQPPEGVAA